MNMEFIDELIMPMITAACLCIGYVMKKWLPTDDKWIPTVLLIFGALSGLILFGADYVGVVKGMVSGIASVGMHQAFKQHLKLPMGEDELYAMGKGEENEDLDIDEDNELTDEEITDEEEYRDESG